MHLLEIPTTSVENFHKLDISCINIIVNKHNNTFTVHIYFFQLFKCFQNLLITIFFYGYLRFKVK